MQIDRNQAKKGVKRPATQGIQPSDLAVKSAKISVNQVVTSREITEKRVKRPVTQGVTPNVMAESVLGLSSGLNLNQSIPHPKETTRVPENKPLRQKPTISSQAEQQAIYNEKT
jgi:hypothetical protein